MDFRIYLLGISMDFRIYLWEYPCILESIFWEYPWILDYILWIPSSGMSYHEPIVTAVINNTSHLNTGLLILNIS